MEKSTDLLMNGSSMASVVLLHFTYVLDHEAENSHLFDRCFKHSHSRLLLVLYMLLCSSKASNKTNKYHHSQFESQG